MTKTFIFDWKEYEDLSRKTAADGYVLIKNDGDVLPLKKGNKVALYGRTQFDYIKSGSGSGGMVNIPYLVNVYDGLKNAGVPIDEEVADIYRAWLKDHPFDKGVGWANEPFSQVEMPLDEEQVKAQAEKNDVAIMVIGRLAGEDKDNVNEAGSYILRDDERAMLECVTKAYSKTVVLINSGNVIDMKWVKEYNPSSVLYVWQGGIEGGNAIADVVTGAVNPSGHLVDTIAYDIEDYPSTKNFGDRFKNVYAEDIFVGYRYFETFAKDKVLYPFGFGLSYTTFEHKASVVFDGENVTVNTTVTNTGSIPGKDAVQVYFKAPSGKLTKAERELVDFGKTGVIKAGKSETVSLTFGISKMCCYDDAGVTGFEHSFVLEAGTYEIYEGEDVRSAALVGNIVLADTVLVEETEPAMYPIEKFERMINKDGVVAFEETPLRKIPTSELIEKERASLKEIPYAGSQKYSLVDVKNGTIDLDTFIGGLSDEEMIEMTRGEGMCSPRVTPGTAGCFAGVTDELVSYGVPSCCCADGPSGIRMDVGQIAMQGSNGVCLACSFDKEAVENFYEYMGKELRMREVDSLLGPGMNIHRSPLNGRNFEYFSEDPLMTGVMAAAELKGLHKSKVTGTIKHFSCNNQELGRHTADTIVSARALREIYLKGYEIAVKEGGAYNIMTSYGRVNGTSTAASFEQNILVVRNDWKYDGLLMTDWWTMIGDVGIEPARKNTSLMIKGGNDLYMVSSNAKRNDNNDDALEGLKNGVYTRAELQRNVRHILRAAMKTNAFRRVCGEIDNWDVSNTPAEAQYEKLVEFAVDADAGTVIDTSLFDTSKGAMNKVFLKLKEKGRFKVVCDVAAEASELAQIAMVFSLNGVPKKVVSRNGAEHEFKTEEFDLESVLSINVYMGFSFNQDGMKIANMRIERKVDPSDDAFLNRD